MANPEHLAILKRGVKVWNEWREKNPGVEPDLSGAIISFPQIEQLTLCPQNLNGVNFRNTNLDGVSLVESSLDMADLSVAYIGNAYLSNASLIGANLCDSCLERATLRWANLHGANLIRTDFSDADLLYADLGEANLTGANLSRANLGETNLINATLINTNLDTASLVNADLEQADLRGCHVYGISAWNVNLLGANQSNLIITRSNEPTITADNLEVAQFIYLLLNNEKIRGVIDTVARKVVLILGRFGEHKPVLDAIREELRKRDYLPVLFDFDKPATRDITETMRTLAHLSRFIIADISDPSSIPLELQAVVPDLAVPVQPLLLSGQKEFSMFHTLRKHHWVLPTHQYTDTADLLASLGDKVIAPAEQKAKELETRST